MTDSTVKNASMIAEDTLIKMKHTACGHIANVPNWIVGELAKEDRMSSKHDEVEIECPVCNDPRRRIKEPLYDCRIKKFIPDHTNMSWYFSMNFYMLFPTHSNS